MVENGLWKYSHGVEDGLQKYIYGFEVILVVEKRLIGSKKVGYWLIFEAKKLNFIFRYTNFWLKMGFGSSLMRLGISTTEGEDRIYMVMKMLDNKHILSSNDHHLGP